MPAWHHIQNYLGNYVAHYFVPGTHNAYRPRILHRPWLMFFLAVTLATEGFLVSNLVARQSDQQFLAAVVPAEIIALTNTEREQNTVGNVKEDALLDQAAQAKAEDMAKAGYFSHVGPDGKTPWQWISASGYQYQYAGENLAVRFIDSKDVINAWMESPTHRANIVKPVYSQIGVGVAIGMYQGQPASYVVQYFGTPKSSVAAVAVAPVTPTKTTKPATQPATLATANPAVEGASTEVAAATPVPTNTHAASINNSASRQFVRLFGEPRQSSALILGLVSVLLVIALITTFFKHLDIQHPNMLAAGSFVLVVALAFLVLNAKLIGGSPGGEQSASVIASTGGVIITPDAAETGYALFPN
jgi:uncharacterized protein YkwD